MFLMFFCVALHRIVRRKIVRPTMEITLKNLTGKQIHEDRKRIKTIKLELDARLIWLSKV